jgi:SAM-dependent methyltransferase
MRKVRPVNPWDQLSVAFGGGAPAEEVPPDAADNILIAWPPMLELIRRTSPDTAGRRALDFGCGAGDLCRALHRLGFQVAGLDTSLGMIAAARQRVPAEVTLVAGPVERLPARESFDLIASVMVFQFVADVDALFNALDRRLRPDGLLVFAVFYPPFVRLLLERGMVFKAFDSQEHPRMGIMELAAGAGVPVFVREADEYADRLARRGYDETLRVCPPFTPEFLAK